MSDLIVEMDSRNRVSLSRVEHKHERYIVREEADGTLVLEPAVVLTRAERAYLADVELRAVVEHGQANPQNRRPRPQRATE